MAKSIAVKTGTYLTELEQENLVNSLFACKEPNVSPFNKPTFITLSVEDLDKKFLSEVKSKVNKISKTNEKISFLLSKRFQIEKKNKDLIKIFLIHLIKSNNSNKVLNYIYSVADIMWKHSNDRSVDFNYYTKRLILSSVYLKILILTFYKDNLTQKDLDKEILKSLEHVKLISQFKIKLDFLKNIKEFFSFFSIQKTSRGF